MMRDNSVKKKILLAEDEVPLLKMVAENLEDAGYDVVRACDGEEALILAFKTRPDLVITDVLMPGRNGNELIKALREHEDYKNTPFIVLTGRGLMRDYFDAIQVDRFVEKPFETAELLKNISELLYSDLLHTPEDPIEVEDNTE